MISRWEVVNTPPCRVPSSEISGVRAALECMRRWRWWWRRGGGGVAVVKWFLLMKIAQCVRALMTLVLQSLR